MSEARNLIENLITELIWSKYDEEIIQKATELSKLIIDYDKE